MKKALLVATILSVGFAGMAEATAVRRSVNPSVVINLSALDDLAKSAAYEKPAKKSKLKTKGKGKNKTEVQSFAEYETQTANQTGYYSPRVVTRDQQPQARQLTIARPASPMAAPVALSEDRQIAQQQVPQQQIPAQPVYQPAAPQIQAPKVVSITPPTLPAKTFITDTSVTIKSKKPAFTPPAPPAPVAMPTMPEPTKLSIPQPMPAPVAAPVTPPALPAPKHIAKAPMLPPMPQAEPQLPPMPAPSKSSAQKLAEIKSSMQEAPAKAPKLPPMPPVKAPEVKVAEAKMPEVNMPEIKVPEVKVPEVKAPALPPMPSRITPPSAPKLPPLPTSNSASKLPPLPALPPLPSAPAPNLAKLPPAPPPIPSAPTLATNLEVPKAPTLPPMPPAPGMIPKEATKPAISAVASAAPDVPAAPVSSAPQASLIYGEAETDLPLAEQTKLQALADKLAADKSLVLNIVSFASGSADQAGAATRTSLARGLNVRRYFLDRNISRERINVRPLGNKSTDGVPDRVDVFLDRASKG